MAHRYISSNRAASSTCVRDTQLTGYCAKLSLYKGYHGAAVGKGRQLAKTELEKLKLSELSTREAVFEAARMYVSVCLWVRPSLTLAQHSPRPRRC